MAYGTKYSITFYDYFNRACALSILKRDFTGASTNLIGTSDVVIIKGESEDNGAFSNIRGIVCEINLQATSLTQYDEFFTADQKEYKIQLSIAGSNYFTGYLEPCICSKEIQVQHKITLNAVCGVAWLKDIDFFTSAQMVSAGSTKISLYSCIRKCLANIETGPIIYDGTDIYRVANGSTSSALTDLYICYYSLRKDNESWVCYDVLKAILKLFLCKIFRYGYNWYIVPCDWSGETLTFKILEGSTGAQTGTSELSMIDIITNNSIELSTLNRFINQSHRHDYNSSYRNLTIRTKRGYNPNIFRPRDVDFTEHHGTSGSWHWQYSEDKILEIVHVEASSNYNDDYLAYTCGYIQSHALHTLNIKFDVVDRNMLGLKIQVFLRNESGSNYRYLDETGKWHSGERFIYQSEVVEDRAQASAASIISFASSGIADAVERATKADVSATSVSITTDEIPIDGYLIVFFRVESASSGIAYPIFAKIDCGSAAIELYRTEYDTPVDEYTYTAEGNENSYFVPEDYELNWSEAPYEPNANLIYDNLLYYKSGDDYIPVRSGSGYGMAWGTTKSGFENNYLSVLLAQRILSIYQRASIRLTGDILCHFDGLTHIKETINYITKIYTILTYEYNVKLAIWNIIAYEVKSYSSGELEGEDVEGIELEESTDILESEEGYIMEQEEAT
jgi:hypothetical protein